MLDIKWIRENPEALDKALANRNAEPAATRLIQLDEDRRRHIARLQEAQGSATPPRRRSARPRPRVTRPRLRR